MSAFLGPRERSVAANGGAAINRSAAREKLTTVAALLLFAAYGCAPSETPDPIGTADGGTPSQSSRDQGEQSDAGQTGSTAPSTSPSSENATSNASEAEPADAGGRACVVDDDCGETTCEPVEACQFEDGVCSGLGTRSCEDHSCQEGRCEVTSRRESEGCIRDTDGAPCDDEQRCTENDTCSEGECIGEAVQCQDDGLFCTAELICTEQDGCSPSASPCAADRSCIEATNSCAIVCEGDRTITTQNEFDSFVAENCGVLMGSLNIRRQDITEISLAGLDALQVIEGTLDLSSEESAGPHSVTTDGLSNLHRIGGDLELGSGADSQGDSVSLEGLTSLTSIGGTLAIEFLRSDLSGLLNLTDLGGLTVFEASANLDALAGLQRINGSVIFELASVSSTFGLRNVKSLAGNLVVFDARVSLDGLANLTKIEGSLSLELHSGSDLSGLRNLTEVGDNVQLRDTQLLSLSGVENLRTIGGDLVIAETRFLNLNALQDIQRVGGNLSIEGSRFTNLDPILNWPDNALEGSIRVNNNEILAACHVDRVVLHLNRACVSCKENNGTGTCQ